MKKHFSCIALLAAAGILTAADPAEAAKAALSKVAPGTITYKDANSWLYSRNELAHLAKGEIANGGVVKISAAKRNQDPIPALVKFNDGLKVLGIKLVVVPVPPKAAVVPFSGLEKGDAVKYLKPFYDELRAKGIEVLDLSDAFMKAGDNTYCRTDAHWSPHGIQIAAAELAKLIPERGKEEFALAAPMLTVSGDLAKSLDTQNPEREDLLFTVVGGKTIDENSPVLLLGDSHTLVFSTGGDMLAEAGGLAEHLALNLKMPVDRIGVKGSAATAVRINLFRKGRKDPAWLKGKKYVVYCFSCREFTESTSGWTIVPVMK
jgi:alginate O-acetyltransferase complex protein AlgJ